MPHRFFPLPDFPRFLLNQTKQLTDLKTLMVSLADCAGTKDFHGDLKEGTPFDDLSSYEHVQRRIEELKTGILRREYEYRMQQRDFHEEEFLPTCLFDLVLVTPPYTTVVYKDLIQVTDTRALSLSLSWICICRPGLGLHLYVSTVYAACVVGWLVCCSRD